jgi:hypothetical protein
MVGFKGSKGLAKDEFMKNMKRNGWKMMKKSKIN